jgi:hypothetical protein
MEPRDPNGIRMDAARGVDHEYVDYGDRPPQNREDLAVHAREWHGGQSFGSLRAHQDAHARGEADHIHDPALLYEHLRATHGEHRMLPDTSPYVLDEIHEQAHQHGRYAPQERWQGTSDAFQGRPHEGPLDPVFGAKRHNWETPEGGKPDSKSRSKTCADCGVSAERYGHQAGSYWGYRMPHGGHEAFPKTAPPCGPEAHKHLYPELGSAGEGLAFLEDIERQNAQPDFKRDALRRALAEAAVVPQQMKGHEPPDEPEHPKDCECTTCEYNRHHSKHGRPVYADLSDEAPELFGALAAEMHDHPEGALDADGLTAGEPAPLDTAALGEFGASRREQLRSRFGFGQAPQYVAGEQPGSDPLDGAATGGGPGMSQHDEDLSPNDTSIQTIGEAQWSGAGSDSSEMGQADADAGAGTEAQIVAAFQASAAAKNLGAGGRGASAAADGDIAARAREFLKTGVLSDGEANDLIAEGKGTRARNLDLLDLEGTHYAAEEDAMKRRGLDLDDFDEDLVLI